MLKKIEQRKLLLTTSLVQPKQFADNFHCLLPFILVLVIICFFRFLFKFVFLLKLTCLIHFNFILENNDSYFFSLKFCTLLFLQQQLMWFAMQKTKERKTKSFITKKAKPFIFLDDRNIAATKQKKYLEVP